MLWEYTTLSTEIAIEFMVIIYYKTEIEHIEHIIDYNLIKI